MDREDYVDGTMHPVKRALAEVTNQERRSGGAGRCDRRRGPAHRALRRAGPAPPSALARMNPDPIVFAMANPDPEVAPEEAMQYARIMATGRSDYPNQINNVLCFPGIFRGRPRRARRRDHRVDEDGGRPARSPTIVADDELREDYIIPSVFNRDVAPGGGRRGGCRGDGRAARPRPAPSSGSGRPVSSSPPGSNPPTTQGVA